MIRRPPRSTLDRSSAASDVYKRQAYDRWWEGRKLWGALVNNSRNLALKLNALLQDPEERAYFRVLIPTYAHVLAAHLLREKTALVLSLIHISEPTRPY